MARQLRPNGNSRTLGTQQSVSGAVKAICDIMRRSNCAGALQYVPELTWILFLRILDEREVREAEEAEAVGAEFPSSLEAPYHCNWGRSIEVLIDRRVIRHSTRLWRGMGRCLFSLLSGCRNLPLMVLASGGRVVENGADLLSCSPSAGK